MILWSHRGYTKKKTEENKVVSLKTSYKKDYRNIEFDIWFLNKEIFLKHNKPTKKQLKDKSLTTLKEYLLVYKNELNYWVDFKNPSKKNFGKALKYFKKIIDKVGINYNQIYFTPYETNWKKAVFFYKKTSKKLPEVNYMFIQDDESFNKEKLPKYENILRENNIKFLSIYQGCVDEKLVKTLKGINLFVWTVDKRKEYERLKKLGIKNICTNKLTYTSIK